MDDITRRICRQMDIPDAVDKLAALPGADLNSLLMEVFSRRAGQVRPQDLPKRYQENRFTHPAQVSPQDYYHTVSALLDMASQAQFRPVMLSPVAPLGTCSAMGATNQNKVISALRGVEVAADPTNALAVHMASLFKAQKNSGAVEHLCAHGRITRAQAFQGPGMFAHFGVLALVSGGKRTASFRSQADMLARHLAFYSALGQVCGFALRFTLNRRGGRADFFDCMVDVVQSASGDAQVKINPADSDNRYYRGFHMKMYLHADGDWQEVADGGFTDWTARMLGDKRYKLFISGLGVDRLLGLSRPG